MPSWFTAETLRRIGTRNPTSRLRSLKLRRLGQRVAAAAREDGYWLFGASALHEASRLKRSQRRDGAHSCSSFATRSVMSMTLLLKLDQDSPGKTDSTIPNIGSDGSMATRRSLTS